MCSMRCSALALPLALAAFVSDLDWATKRDAARAARDIAECTIPAIVWTELRGVAAGGSNECVGAHPRLDCCRGVLPPSPLFVVPHRAYGQWDPALGTAGSSLFCVLAPFRPNP